MHCRSCSNDSIIEIRMQIAGEQLTFHRCGRCEAQSWSTTDGRVPLSRVLQLARNA
jgi:hypothetical protein